MGLMGDFLDWIAGLLGEYQNTQLAGKFKANEVSKGCKLGLHVEWFEVDATNVVSGVNCSNPSLMVCWENIRIPGWQVSSKPMRLAKAARFVGLGKVFC
ncbi:hypothetical protein Q3G72_018356 [Acer saccharum]|nr:hypothetical protein Q3G72_018356 [Acer saccharum]